MQIRLVTQSMLGSSVNTIGKVYNYVLATLPRELLEQANLRPTDRLSKRVDGRKVYLSYNPDGNQYKMGQIGVNEDQLPYKLKIDSENPFMALVDFTIEGDELCFEIPEELFHIRRGFGLLNMFRGFKVA